MQELQQLVEHFCTDREWDQFHNPKDLAIGISTEANELLDIFRFKSEGQMEAMMSDDNHREHIGKNWEIFSSFCYASPRGMVLI